jgi:hypothetical protein
VELPSNNSRISEPAIRLFPNQTDRRLFSFLAVASGPISLMGSSCDRRGSFGNCSYSLLGPRCGRRARAILHGYDGWRADLHQHSVALNRRAYWRPRLDSALERGSVRIRVSRPTRLGVCSTPQGSRNNGLTVFDVIHFLVQRNGYSYHVYPFFWLESVAGGGVEPPAHPSAGSASSYRADYCLIRQEGRPCSRACAKRSICIT